MNRKMFFMAALLMMLLIALSVAEASSLRREFRGSTYAERVQAMREAGRASELTQRQKSSYIAKYGYAGRNLHQVYGALAQKGADAEKRPVVEQVRSKYFASLTRSPWSRIYGQLSQGGLQVQRKPISRWRKKYGTRYNLLRVGLSLRGDSSETSTVSAAE